ncbi:MAG TPA: hypothetical protein VG276_27985 [Actinomycetes bacterium]|jgi:hypothetical protein|nr:hypothetical protein [Actinomycetes bacterium]
MTEPRRALTRGLLQSPSDDEALTFTASTTRLNRYGFRLRHEGWRIDNYNANPVVLWMHIPFLRPIGRGRASLRDGRLLNTITFDRDNPFAADVERQYRAGFLNAVSVGIDFVDKNGAPLTGRLTAEQIEKEAYYDLAEVSSVPVPADPGALKASRVSLAALSMFGRELLEDFGDPEQLAGWEALIADPKLPPAGAPLAPPDFPAPPAPGMTGDRLDRMEATVNRLMDLLEQTLGRALEVPRIQQALVAIPSHTTAVEDSEWDADAAVSGMPNEAATLRYCHAWRDAAGDQDAKASYKFPHHREQGGPANLGGCRNGLARLEGADIPEADKTGVKAHLQNHLDAQTQEGWTPAPNAVQDFLAAIRL